ncbi:hypothetical protein L1987_13158 [Smallanthus sonchifolius]|uniref:Uncharacterized protein n=2 Tax=Smallanthus sonchifolius TaxID=185202 RepID=A0ACB9JHB4_9ASTR|nr:hypothetical protein L1987_13155 [Smallanthus sonchifolius]KAI3819331.1 hypothetical protein L1987_13158 [Smallanthus sonchifolius]
MFRKRSPDFLVHCRFKASMLYNSLKYSNRASNILPINDLKPEIVAVVEQLKSVDVDDLSLTESIKILAKHSTREANVHKIIKSGLVPALVWRLQEHKVEEDSVVTLGLLHQSRIVNAGAIPRLVALLERHVHDQSTHNVSYNCPLTTFFLYLAFEGGTTHLVAILIFIDFDPFKASARTMRKLALKNYANKAEIVRCHALPTFVPMFDPQKAAIHYQAYFVYARASPAEQQDEVWLKH